METGNKREMSLILRQYKLQTGATDFPAILSIPSSDRIATMAKNDFAGVNALIGGALTVAFEAMNFKRSFTADQIWDLSEAIIDTSGEDNLAFEDLMIFLQNLVWGKYDMSHESIDIPKFMKYFEIYRQERYEALMDYRENEHLALKDSGKVDRSTKPETAFEEHLQSYARKLQEKNDEIKLLRKERNKNFQQDNF